MNFGYRLLTEEQQEFRTFIASILPPPPDVSKVMFSNQLMASHDIMQSDIMSKPAVNRQIENSPENTTIISDYTLASFLNSDSKWLVQAQGNAMLSSTLALVKDSMLVIDKRYIFIQLGGNQVFSLNKDKVMSVVFD